MDDDIRSSNAKNSSKIYFQKKKYLLLLTEGLKFMIKILKLDIRISAVMKLNQ